MIASASDAPARAGSADAPERAGSAQALEVFFARVAALPYDVLGELTPEHAREAAAQLAGAAAAMERARPLLEDALHAAIPRVQDRRVRAQLLGLRRRVHAGAVPAPADTAETVLGALDDATRTLVRDWLRDAARLDAAAASLESAHAVDYPDALVRAFARALDDPGFANGVAVASPELVAESRTLLARPGAVARKPQRSLLRYLARAATKTAPFSTLSYVVPLAPADANAAPARAGARIVSEKRLSRAVVLRLRDAAVRAALFESDALCLRVNPSLRHDGGACEVLVAEPLSFGGRPWRKDRMIPFRLGEALSATLAPGAELGSPAAFAARLHAGGLPEADAPRVVRRMIEADVVHVVVPSVAFDEDASEVVAAWLETLGSAAASRTAARLRAMREAVQACALDAPRATAQALVTLRAAEGEALADIGGDASDRYRTTVVEEGWLVASPSAVAPRDLAAPLAALRDVLRARTTVRTRYDELRRAFVERYGAGGVCDDVLGFLAGVEAERARTWRRPAQSQHNDVAGMLDGVPARVTVFCQLVPATADREAAIVVNRVLPGIGWLAARHAACADPAFGALRERLRSWLRDAYGPAEPVDVLLCPEYSDLQRHPRLTARALPWRDDAFTPSPSDVVRREDLRLRHRAGAGTLSFTDAHGAEIAPVYLGAAYPLQVWGPSFDLLAIAAPYAFLLPPPVLLDHDAPDVVAVPRVAEGPVVLRRAAWYVRAAALRAAAERASPARRTGAVVAYLARHGIPLVAFARAYMNRSSLEEFVDDVRTKPLWVDFRNPYSLAAFDDALALSPWIEVSEMLPSPDDLLTDVTGMRRACEFHCEMVL